MKLKQIIAIICIVLLSLMILATLLVAVLGGSKNLLLALVFCDVVIPIVMYAYLLITKQLKK